MWRSLISLAVWGMGSWAYAAGSSVADQEAVTKFMARMQGRRLVHTSKTLIAKDTMEAEFLRETIIGTVRTGELSISFDRIINIKQTNWELDDKKKRTGKSAKKDRSLVSHWEVSRRHSVPGFWGVGNLPTSTYEDPFGNGDSLKVELKGNALHYATKTIGVADYFAKGDTYSPAGSECSGVFQFIDDKLDHTAECTSYDIDAATMKETPRETVSKYHDKEE